MPNQPNLVGIDFSINSPSFCCFKDGQYTWGSLTRSDRSSSSLLKNTKKPFAILDCEPNFVLQFLEKQELPDEYSARERIKITYFSEIVENFWNSIESVMQTNDFYVAMEGLSFSSNGNSLIDISMATALLRQKIISKIGVERFHVFSPTSIKKFAHKGNAKKDELYEALVKFEENGTNLKTLTNILEVNKSEWITPSKVVNKPVDDIVDSTWIALYLKKELGKFYGIQDNLEQTLVQVLDVN